LAHNDVLQQVEILVELIDLGWYARVHLRQHLLLLLDVVDVSLRVVRVLLNPVDLLRNLFL